MNIRLFEWCVSVDHAMVGFPHCDGPAEIVVTLTRGPCAVTETRVWTIDHQTVIAIPNTATFTVTPPDRISIVQHSDDLNRLNVFLTGTVMTVLLHAKGYLVLHGSVFAANGQAYAILADRGWGKSTLTASLASAQQPILSDDLVVIDVDENGQPWVLPSYPIQKIRTDSVLSLSRVDRPITTLYDPPAKHLYSIAHFHPHRLPLRGVFVTEFGSVNSVDKLEPGLYDVNKIIFKYIYRIQLLRKEQLIHQFRLVTHFVSSIRWYKLQRVAEQDSLACLMRFVQDSIKENEHGKENMD